MWVLIRVPCTNMGGPCERVGGEPMYVSPSVAIALDHSFTIAVVLLIKGTSDITAVLLMGFGFDSNCTSYNYFTVDSSCTSDRSCTSDSCCRLL